MSGTSYAKTRRASVEHWRVMHALSQVDSGRERVCVLHSRRELCNFTLLGARSTHPGAMHCEVGERMGHEGIKKQTEVEQKGTGFLVIELKVSKTLDGVHIGLCIRYNVFIPYRCSQIYPAPFGLL